MALNRRYKNNDSLVFDTITKARGLTMRELMQKTGMTRTTVQRHLDRLQDQKLVKVRTRARAPGANRAGTLPYEYHHASSV